MAEVFLAVRRDGTGGEVVIKRVLPALGTDRDFLEMFLDEARLAAQLNHPNLVHVLDMGQVEGSLFLTMDFVDGLSLNRLLENAAVASTPFPWQVATEIASSVCAA